MGEWSLNGKVVLITGGARGIGAATALQLSRRGALPVLADLDAAALAATAGTMSPAPLTIELDVTDPDACEAAVARVRTELGRLDVVWANAGIATAAPLALGDPAAWRRTIEVNVLGAYNTIRAGIEAVIAERGYIAVTASLASFSHPPLLSAYTASKAGVEAMCDALRIEVAHHGVAVGTIHPTWIDTDMVREGDTQQRAFQQLRRTMRPPFARTYPVARVARDIAAGFARRRRRICSPWWVQSAHAGRALLTTGPLERDQRRAMGEMERLFRQDVAERGVQGASVSERVAAQLR